MKTYEYLEDVLGSGNGLESLEDAVEKLPIDLRWNDLGEFISKDEAKLFYFYDFELDKTIIRKTNFWNKKKGDYNKEDVIRQRIYGNKRIIDYVMSHHNADYDGDISLDDIEIVASLNDLERAFVENFYCGRGERRDDKLISIKKKDLSHLFELQNHYLDRLLKGYKLLNRVRGCKSEVRDTVNYNEKNKNQTILVSQIIDLFGITKDAIRKYMTFGVIKYNKDLDDDGDAGLELRGVLDAVLEEYANFRRIAVAYPHMKITGQQLLDHGLSEGIFNELKANNGKYDVQEVNCKLTEKQREIKKLLESLPKPREATFDEMEKRIVAVSKDNIGKQRKKVKISELESLLRDDFGIEQFDFKRLGIKQYKKNPFVPFQKREYVLINDVVEAVIKRNGQITYETCFWYHYDYFNGKFIKYSEFADSIHLPEPTRGFLKKLYTEHRLKGLYENGEIISIIPDKFDKLVGLHTKAIETAKVKL